MSSLSFHYLSMAVHSMIQKNFMEQVKSSGLTSGQPKILDYLRDHNGANQKEIAAACHIEPGSLTSVLNRMEENGLIERRMLDGNRRTFYIFMTEKGTQLKDIVEKNFVSIEEKAFRNISSEEQAAFMETFSKIYENLMNKGAPSMNKLIRYIIFLIGLFVNSLGVSLITKANLGTSPISSIPYVLSLNFPLTLGNFTIIFSLLLIFLQLLILRKNFKPEYYLQIPVSILFGYFIDFTMILMAFVQPESYPSKIIYLLIGCVILGFGVYIEVLADVVMLPGESFVRAIVQTWNREFGSTKVCFDVSMAVIAAVLSFVLAHRLDGVREGTVIAALLVGFIARQFGKALTFVKPLLFPEDYAKSAEEESSGKNAKTTANSSEYASVITIGRQYGSGGSELGQILADKLGYNFYDKDEQKKFNRERSQESDSQGGTPQSR